MLLSVFVKRYLSLIALVFMAASGSAQAERVYIQSLSQGPDVGRPTFIFLKIKPSPSVCPQTNVGRLRWNGDVYAQLANSMNAGRPISLTLGQPACVDMEGEIYVNIRNFEFLPMQARPIHPPKRLKKR